MTAERPPVAAGSASSDPAVVALGILAAYNVVQNLLVPDRAYVPANLAVTSGLVAYARWSGLSSADMGLGAGQMRDGVIVGGSIFAAAAVLGAAALRVPGIHPWLLDERARGHGRREAVARSVVRFPLGTALFEEVAFRGVLEALWRRRSGPSSARLVTAAAFGAWHLIPTFRLFPGMAGGRRQATLGERTLAAVTGALVTGLWSFGFSLLREGSGSVAAPWLAHAGYNVVSYLAARRAWQREPR